MLYLAIPAHNEAATIGVLLWRLRAVLAEFPREYEAVVYDDASSDSTSEILESYARVMPLTVIRGDKPIGYSGAVDALVRHIARQTRYPRRDAVLLLQGDFTDPPAMVPEFVKRFEGGADLVVGERAGSALKGAPLPVRRMQRATGWMLRLFVKAQGVRDVTSSYRLIRISVLRDLLRAVGDAPVCAGDSQTANADFLLQLIPLARRVETIAIEPTWGVRIRETRLVAMRDGLALARWAWRARGRRAVASTAPDTSTDTPRAPRTGRSERDASNVLPFESAESPRGAHAHGHSPSRIATVAAPTRKPRAPKPPVVADDDADEATSIDSARTKPPRRKRTRGGRKDGATAETARNSDNETPNAVIQFQRRDEAVDDDGSIGIVGDDDATLERTHEPLSPALSEAAEEAEAEFDAAAGGRPPRKRRRRRGGKNRSGKASADSVAAEGDDAGDETGPDDALASGQDADSSAYADDSDRVLRPRGVRASTDEAGVEGTAAESGEEGEDGEDVSGAEPRARRRGRRGRRGGSRRNRANRTEDGQESSAGGEGSVSEPPAHDHGE